MTRCCKKRVRFPFAMQGVSVTVICLVAVTRMVALHCLSGSLHSIYLELRTKVPVKEMILSEVVLTSFV